MSNPKDPFYCDPERHIYNGWQLITPERYNAYMDKMQRERGLVVDRDSSGRVRYRRVGEQK